MAKNKPVCPDLNQIGAAEYQFDDVDVKVPKCNPSVGMATQEEYDPMADSEEGDDY